MQGKYTLIQNGQKFEVCQGDVVLIGSNIAHEYCVSEPTRILLDEGFIKDYKVTEDNKQGIITVTLKYGEGKTRIIEGLRRVSKPGLKIYASCKDLPKVRNGLGIAILSTSKGIMTDKQARQENIGGEVLAFVW